MSFSTELKEEISKSEKLSNKEVVKYELMGYLMSSNISEEKNKIKFSTENEYNINRFARLLSNCGIETYNINIQGKLFVITCPKVEIQIENLTIEQLKNIKPDIHVDDKESIINSLPSDIKCMYISSSYNKNIDEKKAVKVDTYENWNLINKIDKISVDKKVENVVTYPNIKNTEFNYKLVKSIGTPFVKFLYKPIILNKQNLVSNGPVVYASNHRKTLDPFFLVMSVDDAIHWAALRRFFTGEDSIFNNSKNPILCKITSKLFHGMGLIPVNRGGDNHEMIDLTNYYLKNGSNIGIFPEGTTNKNPANGEILEVKNGAFRFAKDNNALIQPISIVWFPKLKKIKHRVIINYGVPFTMSNITIEEGKKIWTDSVLKGIEENKQIIDNVVDSEKRIKR